MLCRATLTAALALPVALAAPTAVAADFTDVPPIVPFVEPMPEVADLTGAYVGASVGYAFERDHGVVTTGTPGFQALGPAVAPVRLDTGSENGFAVSLHGGTNLALTDRFVVGAEADVTFGQLSTSGESVGTVAVAGTTLRTSAEIDMNWLGTARVRAGVMAFDDLLVYGTAGLAFGHVDVKTAVTGIANPAFAWNGANDDIEVGYALGAGAEYALGPGVSLRADYLYYDLGDVDVTAAGNVAVRANPALTGADYVSRTRVDGHILRAGLNLRVSNLF